MGATLTATPLDDEARRWVESLGTTDVPAASGRWPTEPELRAVLEGLPHLTSRYETTDRGWDASVRDRDGTIRADLWVTAPAAGQPYPTWSFHKPNPDVAILITRAIAAVCGPFLMVDAAMMSPAIVVADSDVQQVLRDLHHAR